MKNTEEATRALALIEIATEALDRAYYPDDECEEVRSDALGMARQLARIIKYVTSDYEGAPVLIPLQRDRLVWDETYEEWLERTQDGPGRGAWNRHADRQPDNGE